MRLPASARFVSIARAGAWLAVVMAGRAVAAAGPAELWVDCPALSGELRSSLEARTRAELTMKQISDGRLSIRCASERAWVEFEPAQGAGRSRDSALTGELQDIVEQILALVHEVTVPAEANSDGAGAGQSSLEPSTAADTPSLTDSTSPNLPPLEAAPAPAAPPPAAAVAPASGPVAGTRSAPVRLEPGIGLCGELWAAEPLPLLGPCASFGIRLRPTWRIAATLAGGWSATVPSGIAVRILGGGIEASLGEPLWLGVGARASWLHLTPDTGFSPSAQNAVQPELNLRAGYSWGGPRQRLAAALGLRAYPEYRDVQTNGSVAFRVPAIAFTASLEYRLALIPSLPGE